MAVFGVTADKKQGRGLEAPFEPLDHSLERQFNGIRLPGNEILLKRLPQNPDFGQVNVGKLVFTTCETKKSGKKI